MVILMGVRPAEFRTNDPFVWLLSLTKSLMVPQTTATVAGALADGVGVGVVIGVALQAV